MLRVMDRVRVVDHPPSCLGDSDSLLGYHFRETVDYAFLVAIHV
jgi:hypothetical protein